MYCVNPASNHVPKVAVRVASLCSSLPAYVPKCAQVMMVLVGTWILMIAASEVGQITPHIHSHIPSTSSSWLCVCEIWLVSPFKRLSWLTMLYNVLLMFQFGVTRRERTLLRRAVEATERNLAAEAAG